MKLFSIPIGGAIILILGGCYRDELDAQKNRISSLETTVSRIKERTDKLATDFGLEKTPIYVAKVDLEIYSEPDLAPAANTLIGIAKAGAFFRRTSNQQKDTGAVPVEFPIGGEMIAGYVRAENLRREMIDLGVFTRYGATNPIDYQWQNIVLKALRDQSLKRLGINVVNRVKAPQRQIEDMFDYVHGRLVNKGLSIKWQRTDDIDIQSGAFKNLDAEAILQIIIDEKRVRLRLVKFDGTMLHTGFLSYIRVE